MNAHILEASLTFLDALNEEDKKRIIDNTSLKTYCKGENIHSADNDCVGVLIVASGELRTYILSHEGKEVTLYRLRKGDVCILSASCLIKNLSFDVYIDAELDSEVLLLSSAEFAKLQAKNVYVENFALKVAVEKFSDVMWAMQQLLFLSFDSRLAAFLIDESVKTGTDDIKLTHEQIAKYVGSAREVVSRMMKHFENEGFVKSYRGGVTLLNKQDLRKLIP